MNNKRVTPRRRYHFHELDEVLVAVLLIDADTVLDSDWDVHRRLIKKGEKKR